VSKPTTQTKPSPTQRNWQDITSISWSGNIEGWPTAGHEPATPLQANSPLLGAASPDRSLQTDQGLRQAAMVVLSARPATRGDVTAGGRPSLRAIAIVS